MKMLKKSIGAIAIAVVTCAIVCACDSGSKNNYNYGSKSNSHYSYGSSSDGLSEAIKAQQEARKAEEKTRQQTIEFLNNAYGYDVSSYVD